MGTTKLSAGELEQRLRDPALRGWVVQQGKLHREYRFGDFTVAFGFMASAALCAEAQNHHPEWSNVYERVVVDLVTHDEGGITERDLRLAAAMEQLARPLARE